MRFIKIIFVLLITQFSAQASLIQWDAFDSGDQLAVKDLDTGTIWLDLSVTAGTGYFQAGNLFADWGYATNSQVEDLLAKAFPDFVSNNNFEYQTNCVLGQACFEQSEDWLSLFGGTAHQQNALVQYGFGLYLDEDSIVRMGGSRINGSLNNAYLYGDEFTVDYSSYIAASPGYFYSTFLVLQQTPDFGSIDAQLSESGLASMFAGLLGFMLIRRRNA